MSPEIHRTPQPNLERFKRFEAKHGLDNLFEAIANQAVCEELEIRMSLPQKQLLARLPSKPLLLDQPASDTEVAALAERFRGDQAQWHEYLVWSSRILFARYQYQTMDTFLGVDYASRQTKTKLTGTVDLNRLRAQLIDADLTPSQRQALHAIQIRLVQTQREPTLALLTTLQKTSNYLTASGSNLTDICVHLTHESPTKLKQAMQKRLANSTNVKKFGAAIAHQAEGTWKSATRPIPYFDLLAERSRFVAAHEQSAHLPTNNKALLTMLKKDMGIQDVNLGAVDFDDRPGKPDTSFNMGYTDENGDAALVQIYPGFDSPASTAKAMAHELTHAWHNTCLEHAAQKAGKSLSDAYRDVKQESREMFAVAVETAAARHYHLDQTPPELDLQHQMRDQRYAVDGILNLTALEMTAAGKTPSEIYTVLERLAYSPNSGLLLVPAAYNGITNYIDLRAYYDLPTLFKPLEYASGSQYTTPSSTSDLDTIMQTRFGSDWFGNRQAMKHIEHLMNQSLTRQPRELLASAML